MYILDVLMNRFTVVFLLLFHSSISVSAESININILPDPYKCHQLGLEVGITGNSSLGVLARNDCKTDRPTFGGTNDDVKNTFSRVLVPFRYSKNGVFKNGFIMQSLIGIEQSKFKTTLGSDASVTFIDLAFHFGYQWFWENGFNVSALGGPTFLIKNSSNKNIVQNESSDVLKFLDENTESNVHPGVGIIFGWVF